MIVACNYEEITALTHGARSLLVDQPDRGGQVAAPPAMRGAVETLLARLDGDLTVRTLARQEELEGVVEAIVAHLHQELEANVVATHPAAEEAVSAYFDYAHALAVLGRIREMGQEMRALAELMTGVAPTEPMARHFVFPD